MYKILIILGFFLFSCTDAENRSKVEEKKKSVMEIHDIAMEKMSDMVKLKSKLKSKLNTDTSNIDELKKVILDLEDADKLMWDWMHNYHSEIVDTSKIENAMHYLDEQYKSVKIVEEKINESIKNGEALL